MGHLGHPVIYPLHFCLGRLYNFILFAGALQVTARPPQQLLHGGGLDRVEVVLHVPHLRHGGAHREVQCPEPVERAADSLGSRLEDAVSPAVARVLREQIFIFSVDKNYFIQ